MPEGCRHKPACPLTANRFVCGQRSLMEDAVHCGLITRQSAENIMRLYGVERLTPPSKVYRGEPVLDAAQVELEWGKL